MAYLSLQKWRNLLYSTLAVSSSKLLHQRHQLEQVLVAEQAAASSHGHKRIFRQNRCPGGRNRGPPPFGIVEVDSVLAPIVPVGHQLKALAFLWMKGMGDLEVAIASVAITCG